MTERGALWRAALLLAGLAIVAAAAPAGAMPAPLTIAGGTYRVVAPPGWDGRRPVPLVLYLHGYGQSSAQVLDDTALVAAVASTGVLLVVPDGANGSWAHVGSPSHARDDIAFLGAVVADAERRWPVNRARVIAAGFSQGASMVWDLACHAATGFTAFLPISGGFWLPYPTRCTTGPFNLRHIHGLADATVPMAGRTVLSIYHQGDILKGFAILRATDRCAAEPDRKIMEGALDCAIWSSCASGRQLQLCLHSGDHVLNPVWLHDGIVWALGLPAPAGSR